MKGHFKKKLVSSTWVDHVEKSWRRKTGNESRCPEGGGEIEARNTEIAMGDCIISDHLERVGEEREHYR